MRTWPAMRQDINSNRRRLSGVQLSWWLPGWIALFCVTAQALTGADALRFERSLVVTEPWRLLSAHFIHLGWTHLALNLAGLALTWAIVGRTLREVCWAVAVPCCALVVSAGLYVRDTGIDWYVGLSGVLHGLFTLGALAGLPQARLFHSLLLVGIVAKVGWELAYGLNGNAAEWIGGAVVVNAHVYGVVAGFASLPLAAVCRHADTRGKPGSD